MGVSTRMIVLAVSSAVIAHSGHQASDLFWTPPFTDQSAHPIDQRRHPFVGLGGQPSSLVAALLRLIGLVVPGDPVATQLPAYGAAVATQHLGNLALALPRHKQGGNLVSLFLGQLSVSHHCFTLVGKANEGTGNDPPSSTSLSQSAAVII